MPIIIHGEIQLLGQWLTLRVILSLHHILRIIFLLLTLSNLGTNYDMHYNRESTIYLVFGSGKFHLVDKVFKDHLMGSDHYPILYCFNFRQDTFINVSPYRWIFNRINWKMWADKLTSAFEGVTSPSLISISDKIINTTKIFTELKSTRKIPKYNKPF